MQIVIDIPEDSYERVMNPDKFYRDIDGGKIRWAVYKGTPIPDNATNGDVIHGLYMPYGYVVNDDYDEVVISAEGVDMRFSKTWWNAPYKAERR